MFSLDFVMITMLGKVWYLWFCNDGYPCLRVRPQLCTYRIRGCDLHTELQGGSFMYICVGHSLSMLVLYTVTYVPIISFFWIFIIPIVFQLSIISPFKHHQIPILEAGPFDVFSLLKPPNLEAERENRFGALQAQHRVPGPWKAGDGGGDIRI